MGVVAVRAYGGLVYVLGCSQAKLSPSELALQFQRGVTTLNHLHHEDPRSAQSVPGLSRQMQSPQLLPGHFKRRGLVYPFRSEFLRVAPVFQGFSAALTSRS